MKKSDDAFMTSKPPPIILNRSEFDPQAADFIRNPYPIYDELRASTPIFYHVESQLWFCTAYEDVDSLLRDKRLGRSIDHVLSPEERGAATDPPEYEPFLKLGANSMFDKEPPDHTRLKNLVHKAFTPRRINQLRGRIQAIADALVDQVYDRHQFDIIADYAAPLPVTVIAELLGVPEQDRHLLRPWSRDIVAMYELDHTPEQAEKAILAAAEFSDYLRHLARRRREDPGDDLITALAFVEESGDQLSEDELIANCVLLLNAGHEATVNVIGNGMLALFKHPEQLEELRDDPSLVDTAVEEMMRYDTPLQMFRRWVLEDFEYKGIDFQKGMRLGLIFGAANRDPARFENPNTFDITRRDNPQISFGAGIHYCLGAPLARLELRIGVNTLLQRLPNMRLADPEPEYRDAYVIRGLKALYVSFR